MLDMLSRLDWSVLKEKYGDNKDWQNKTCGCGYSIDCDCGWCFTACLILENDGSPLKQKTTSCPYCGTRCEILCLYMLEYVQSDGGEK